MNLTHYYHIYAIKDYGRIVKEHLDALERSGLAGEIDFNIGVIGDKRSRNDAIALCKSKITTNVILEEDEGWEVDTLQILSHNIPEGNILYAHTKGVTKDDENDAWRRNMTKKLVYEWKNCIELLKTHDATGCYWCVDNRFENHYASLFAGHFWWATSDFLKQLPPPKEFGLDINRYVIEYWLSIKDPNVANLLEGDLRQWLDWPGFQLPNWNTNS